MPKSVLITGCNPGGIGNALAREFHSRGLRVFATARQTSSIADLSSIGITALSLEVTEAASISALRASIEEMTAGAGLDYLINNAGRNYCMPALDAADDEIRNVFEINVFAVMKMCQTFTPLLIQAKGMIVQIGSVAAVLPYAFGGIYNASKAALHSYSDTLRVEVAPFGVHVLTVVTGGVESRIARNTRPLPQHSLYLPLEVEFDRRQVHSQEGAMRNVAYAKSVVDQVLSWRARGRQKVWEGNKSWVVWFAYWFMPHRLMDSVLSRMFNLGKLNGFAAAKKLT